MIRRDHGVFVCVSSAGMAFLGGYETFKAAQIHLAYTLDAELAETKVAAFTIGPGLVPTETASQAVKQLAPRMGLSEEEFYALNKNALLSIEEAGAGFACSILLADRFRGQEISSIQALKAADINYGIGGTENHPFTMELEKRKQVEKLCEAVLHTLREQSEGWKTRSLFERQWVLRDFKKSSGMPVEEWLSMLEELKEQLCSQNDIKCPPLEKLAGYYDHLAEVSKGYEKNTTILEENLRHIYGWREEVENLEKSLE
jgi:hypothetical protein